MGKANKNPRSRRFPGDQKKPLNPYIPGSGSRLRDDHVSWRFEFLGTEPIYGIGGLCGDDSAALIKRLCALENTRINELFHSSDDTIKDYNVDKIPNAKASKRLADQYPDQTKIYRLRCGGKKRLYGFLAENVFHALWWDPDHEIWPTKKKHT